MSRSTKWRASAGEFNYPNGSVQGGQVKAGQLLFVLDSAEVEAQVSQSIAQTVQVQAQLDDAMRDYARGAVSRDPFSSGRDDDAAAIPQDHFGRRPDRADRPILAVAEID